MKKSLLLVFAVLLISNLSFSQDGKFTKKGQTELIASISFASTTPVLGGTTGESTSTFSLAPYVGYFVIDGFEVGLGAGITSQSGNSGYTSYAFVVAPAYNFNTKSRFYPYVQGEVGYNSIKYSGSSSLSGIVWGFEGGLKINVIGNGLLKFGLNYDQYTQKIDGIDGRSGNNVITAFGGIGLFF